MAYYNCYGGNCMVKESCKRFSVNPKEQRQTYFNTPPLDENGNCDFYHGENQTNILEQLKEIDE